MSQCRGCGAHVTDDFARVFGTEAGEALACLECATHEELTRGAAAGLTPEGRA